MAPPSKGISEVAFKAQPCPYRLQLQDRPQTKETFVCSSACQGPRNVIKINTSTKRQAPVWGSLLHSNGPVSLTLGNLLVQLETTRYEGNDILIIAEFTEFLTMSVIL